MKKLEQGIPFVGVTRFSVYTPQNSGLNTSARHGENEQAYLEELYSPDRIVDRLRIFGEISAPVYQSFAEENDYTHLVQYSAEMPEEYKIELFEIAKRFPVVKPVLVTHETMDESVQKFVRTWDAAFSGVFVWLRVDDDDILSVDYLEALKPHATLSNVGFAVSFSTVMVAQYACGNFVNFRQAKLPKNSIGQAYIGYANLNTGVFDVPEQIPHHRIDEYMPLILDPRGIRGLQVRHAWQDTSNTSSKVGHRIAHRSFELGSLPNVNISHTQGKFPTVPVEASVPDNSPSAKVELHVGEWANVASTFSDFNDGVVVRFRWQSDFHGTPDDGASLSIEFDTESSADGHFPKDDARGNYRRLHVNSNGHGENFLVFPHGASPIRMRLNADGEKQDVRSSTIEFWEIGQL